MALPGLPHDAVYRDVVAQGIPDVPVSMSAAQITAFAAIYPRNCRPAQPLGERISFWWMMPVPGKPGRAPEGWIVSA